jgi:hypothetical protein
LLRATTFDFILGDWSVHNRRRNDYRPDRAAAGWSEFPSRMQASPILGGWGVIDTYDFHQFPGRGPGHAIALRLGDPQASLWRIWWGSTFRAGSLDAPVVGGFVRGEGVFAGEDSFMGATVLVLTRYSDITSEAFRWEQMFSFNGGETWATNWIMGFHRTRPAAKLSGVSGPRL